MNKTIYSSSMKKSTVFLSSIIICVVGLIVCFIILFPSISSGNSYADFLKSLPQGMLSAIGMNGDISNLNEYLNMNFYNSIYLYILMTYVIVTAANLIAKPIEDTSLVYYLNSPVSRKTFLYSQAFVFITGMLAVCASSIIFTIISKWIFAGSYAFNIADFIKDNAALGCIFLFLGSISILFCSISKKSSQAIAYGSTIIIGEYILDMLVKISPKVDWMRYTTVFTFYNTDKIKGNLSYFYSTCGILLVFSAAIILISAELFKKRDLYL